VDKPASPTVGTPHPLFLSTAIEAVVRAGDLQIAKFNTGVRVEKKAPSIWSPKSISKSSGCFAR
jgi:hypothetical protein